jgi:DNA-binding CsgD family transcriptional regulator
MNIAAAYSASHTAASNAAAQAAHQAAAHAHPANSRAARLAALGHCLLERLETPLFVADAQGAVLEANPAASRRIERRDGLWLDAGGRVALRQAGRWVPLSYWAAALAGGQELTLPLEMDGGGSPMQISLRGMSAGDGIPSGFGWIVATIERVTLSRADAMRRRFRFTQTQAKLAEMLCKGMRPTHATEALGVKISTIRTHVGQMYEKTGTHSQAQLVALLHAV